MVSAVIYDHGHGLPGVGDYIEADDGEVYEILRVFGPTMHAIEGSSVQAELKHVDVDDLDDEPELFKAGANLDDFDELEAIENSLLGHMAANPREDDE
jgi:hypothetical protein